MNLEPSDIAILLFARSSESEAASKHFVRERSLRVNRQVADMLLDHTLKCALSSQLPVFHLDETVQSGKSFGERLANAFQRVYAQGYQKVIGIGSDCAGIDRKTLEQAAGHLQNSQSVLGPAVDGGVYLIGLTRENFAELDFSAISWQTEDVFEELKLQLGKVQVLSPKNDIDHSRDLDQLLKLRSIPQRLRYQLQKALHAASIPFSRNTQTQVTHRIYSTHSLRGPPPFPPTFS